MSFILDALRKSEHERQRSTVPGLTQIPLATPAAQPPRWALVVIGVLAVAVLALGGAWWQSERTPAVVAAAPPVLVEREVALPPPAPRSSAAALSPPAAQAQPRSLAEASSAPSDAPDPAAPAQPAAPVSSAATDGDVRLPSADALIAQGVALPRLRLELHAFSDRPSDRFVFINGRKYLSGERLPEGPQLVAIEPRGAVLVHNGQSFLLTPE